MIPARRRLRRAGRGEVLALSAVLLAGCSWHRVEPRFEGAPSQRMKDTVGLAAADGDTSLADLRAIARLWTQWEAFERVQFPFREGDAADLVVELRLRQHADLHRGPNRLKAVAVGLSLGLLSPAVGPRITESHAVTMRCIRGATIVGPIDLAVSTDAVFGVGADPSLVAKALDDEHMKRIASRVLESVVSSCRTGARGPFERP